MSRTQDEILKDLAEKHGIGIMMARTIIHSYFEVIAKNLNHRNEDGTYDAEKIGQSRIKFFGTIKVMEGKCNHENKKKLKRIEDGYEPGK